MWQQNTLRAQYLSGAKKVSRTPVKVYENVYKIHLKKSYKNNLKIDEVSFPLYSFTVVCGVSGSGKSTLVLDELIPELKLILNNHESERLKGSLNLIKNIEYVDQNPIGRSTRSNPVTYVKAFDDIRAMFASLPLSNIRNYEAKHFSLNVPGGRCEKCAFKFPAAQISIEPSSAKRRHTFNGESSPQFNEVSTARDPKWD